MKIINELEASFLFENISILTAKEDLSLSQKLRKINIVFLNLINSITAKKEKQLFTSWLSKINFVIQSQSLDQNIEKRIFLMQRIMRVNAKNPNFVANENHWAFCLALTSELIEKFSEIAQPEAILNFIAKFDFSNYNLSVALEKQVKELRAIFIQEEKQSTDELGRVQREILCKAKDYGDIRLILTDVIFYQNNEKVYTYPLAKESSWLRAGQEFLLTRVLHLEENIFAADDESILVFTPDYLVDVTRISTACESLSNYSGYFAILSRFLMFEGSEHTLIGNLVNSMLDSLIVEKEISFEDALERATKDNLLDVVKFDDGNIKNAESKLRAEFETLKKCIEPYRQNQLTTEPTFISAAYGLQGRLDILVEFEEAKSRKDIIELKSSRLINGVLASFPHKIQVAGYNLLLDSNFSQRNGISAILYSRDEKNPLRNLGKLEHEKRVAMLVRNQIVALEIALAERNFVVFDKMETVGNKSFLGDFTKKKFTSFGSKFRQANDLSRAYFVEFSAFVAREMLTAKLGGVEETEPATGFASLWNLGKDEKKDNFSMLDDLTFTRFNAEDSSLIFQRKSTGISVFRAGDLVVLYPYTAASNNPLFQQILKGNILEISSSEIKVRLHHKFVDDSFFVSKEAWAIEANFYEKGFDNSFQGLYHLLAAHDDTLNLFFGKTRPRFDDKFKIDYSKEGLNENQNEVLRKALSAQDYFLLQGPPGTGKTSKMLKNMVHFLFHQTKETIVLLAFTNRATDEICEKVAQICGDNFIRLGNTEGKWASNTLKNVDNVEILRQKFENCRVFVGTVAVFPTYSSIIKQKDTVIVDEASQLLEPHLCGILTIFKRFILIGDEKQLPAVVTQSEKFCVVENDLLKNIGIKRLSTSLFERLLRNAQEKKWHEAYEMLKMQYRTHTDIVGFINTKFYHALESALDWQNEKFNYYENSPQAPLAELLLRSRLIFIETDIENNIKVNHQEANFVQQFITQIKNLKGDNFNENTLGVITPYRAQIAEIDALLDDDLRKNLTIDTVERFQGSERDVIMISMAVNQAKMMMSVQSLDEDEKIDKKLNVALSRARQQLILMGNEQILNNAKFYSELVHFIKQHGIFIKRQDTHQFFEKTILAVKSQNA